MSLLSHLSLEYNRNSPERFSSPEYLEYYIGRAYVCTTFQVQQLFGLTSRNSVLTFFRIARLLTMTKPSKNSRKPTPHYNKKKNLSQSGTKLPSGSLIELGKVAVRSDNASVNTATKPNDTPAFPSGMQAMTMKKVDDQVQAPVQLSTTTDIVVHQTKATKIQSLPHGSTTALALAKDAEPSKNKATVTRNDIRTVQQVTKEKQESSSEQKKETLKEKSNTSFTPLKYARASELLEAAREPVDLSPSTIAGIVAKTPPHTNQRMTRSVTKQGRQSEQVMLQQMASASIDDINSDDYSYNIARTRIRMTTWYHPNILLTLTTSQHHQLMGRKTELQVQTSTMTPRKAAPLRKGTRSRMQKMLLMQRNGKCTNEPCRHRTTNAVHS